MLLSQLDLTTHETMILCYFLATISNKPWVSLDRNKKRTDVTEKEKTEIAKLKCAKAIRGYIARLESK
jgi:hypothetical protein